MHKELIELADRLKREGRDDDAALVYSAAILSAPGPEPTYEQASEVVPGYFHSVRAWL